MIKKWISTIFTAFLILGLPAHVFANGYQKHISNTTSYPKTGLSNLNQTEQMNLELRISNRLRGQSFEVKEDIIYDETTKDTSLIEEYIYQNIDWQFDPDKYDISIFDEEIDKYGFGTVTYNYCIGNYKTKVVYIALINDFKFSSVIVFGTPIYEDEIPPTVNMTEFLTEKIKNKAVENNFLLENGFKIIGQHIFIKTDNKTLKPYAVVLTDFELRKNQRLESRTSEVYNYFFDDSELTQILN